MPIKTITIDTDQWAVVPMELLSELAESLACELDARYPACNRAYPSQERKYQSAMEPVFKSRALLLTQQPEQAPRSDDVLAAALDNLVHDNYERSQCGSKNRQADADLIRAALARTQQPAPRQVPTIILGKGDKLVADIFQDDETGVVHMAGVGIFDPEPGKVYGVGVRDEAIDGKAVTEGNPLVMIWSDKPESLQVIIDELQESIVRMVGIQPALAAFEHGDSQ